MPLAFVNTAKDAEGNPLTATLSEGGSDVNLWGGRRLGRYETLKRLAEEQNQLKDSIHRKITSRKPGDRILTRHEYRTMGLAWAAGKRGNRLSRLVRLAR
jgi:hypothetical protein